jgi:tRNA threonylcarbamoyladenosine biosynthesis protein TsaB
MNTLSHETQQSINILAFDTSGDEASLALWTNEKMLKVSIPVGTGVHSQAACLIPLMQDLLSEANIDFHDLHVIATSKGPGSFTGIRIGLATAQGLMSSTQAMVFAPTTFEVAAFGAWVQKVDSYFVTITTKRGSYYCQGFDETLVPQGQASIMTDQEIHDYLTQNPHITRLNHPSIVQAEQLLHLCLRTFKTDEIRRSQTPLESSRILRPYYLHDPEFVKQKPWSL